MPSSSRKPGVMNVPFGAALTREAALPLGAGSSFAVKYPEPPSALPKLVAFVVFVAFALSLLNHYGLVHRLSGGSFGSPPAAERGVADEPASAA